ncbi:patatin [Robertkochia marina]|uniref:Patatin n=1 Tax=Robertkochia marina TaxID=1227945 RepID=A0A4S3M2K4_9FLAO|nr:patatin-like phospholipase family protein [Robertkochia marina]THD67839.1 patatin [Robertkochia marina]TRZ42122.1 patatin [Robertkochia marina]
MSAKSQKPYRFGFVLGGGGARGFAHLGAIKALEEKGIRPDIISGVSAGAVAGAFIAAGRSPEATHELMKSLSIRDLTNFQMPKTGLFNLNRLKSLLQEHLGDKDIKDLEIPLVIAATDILNGKVTYFKEGDLSTIVQASASIPVLFSPVKINDLYYVDGGVFNNVPLEPLKDCCDHTVVINISPMDKIETLGGIASIAARTFQLSVNAANRSIEGQCDIYLRPEELASYPIFDTQKADELFEIGYNYTKEQSFDIPEKTEPGFWQQLTSWFNKRSDVID